MESNTVTVSCEPTGSSWSWTHCRRKHCGPWRMKKSRAEIGGTWAEKWRVLIRSSQRIAKGISILGNGFPPGASCQGELCRTRRTLWVKHVFLFGVHGSHELHFNGIYWSNLKNGTCKKQSTEAGYGLKRKSCSFLLDHSMDSWVPHPFSLLSPATRISSNGFWKAAGDVFISFCDRHWWRMSIYLFIF